jgi:polar amino acid transport system ATP-binding protein
MSSHTAPASKDLSESEGGPLFEAAGIHKSFGDNEVLKGIDVAVRKGDVLVIMGPSGSGKSTLCRVMVGLEPFDRGELRLHGKRLAHVTDRGRVKWAEDSKALRLDIGMVFQHFALFPNLTVFENLSLAPLKVRRRGSSEATRLATDVLQRVHLTEKRDEYPSRLSGGQQQRVAIARELAMEREILFLDEPTSALDPELVREVLVVMKELGAAGMTMVVVTHEMAFARQAASWVVFMSEGEIIEQGPPDQLFGRPLEQRTREFLAGPDDQE